MDSRIVANGLYVIVDPDDFDQATTWPTAVGGTEWELRYGTAEGVLDARMHAASVLAAYGDMVDPTISQREAVDQLKRARRAAQAANEIVQ